MDGVRVAWLAAIASAALGCAEGMPGPDEFGRPQGLGNETSALPVVGGDASLPGAPVGPAVVMGIPCMKDQQVDCVCADGVSMGVQRCKHDDLSPTMGSLGVCELCRLPPPPAMPDAGPGDVGTAGTDSMSGSATAGSAATDAGASDAGMAMEPECDPATCPEKTDLFGLPLTSCCTRRGECGTRSLLLGVCN